MLNPPVPPAATFYANLMEEAKIRLTCIEHAIQDKTGLPSPAVREFCFLQLRMLCEVVMLGCLVAHGDITAKNAPRLLGEYAPGKIVKLLDRLKPDFYPHPATLTWMAAADALTEHWHLQPKRDGFLTKKGLVQLWNRSGDYLHRLPIKKLLSAQSEIERDFEYIVSSQRRLLSLLDIHRIAFVGNKTHWLCIMKNPDDSNRVQVSVLESQLPP